MGRCRIWIVRLALAMSVFWASAGLSGAQDTASQCKAASRIPLGNVPESIRDRVRRVVQEPILFSHGPAEAFDGLPSLYAHLLDHPDQAMRAWRRLGAKCTEITDQGDGHFLWTDGHGSEIRWQTAFNDATQRIWFAEGKVRPAPALPPVPVEVVLHLRHGQRRDGLKRTLIYHQADVFLKTDSKTAALVTRLMGPSAPRIAESCLGQMETFFSGLVWYLDQHPDRTERLFAQAGPPR